MCKVLRLCCVHLSLGDVMWSTYHTGNNTHALQVFNLRRVTPKNLESTPSAKITNKRPNNSQTRPQNPHKSQSRHQNPTARGRGHSANLCAKWAGEYSRVHNRRQRGNYCRWGRTRNDNSQTTATTWSGFSFQRIAIQEVRIRSALSCELSSAAKGFRSYGKVSMIFVYGDHLKNWQSVLNRAERVLFGHQWCANHIPIFCCFMKIVVFCCRCRQ